MRHQLNKKPKSQNMLTHNKLYQTLIILCFTLTTFNAIAVESDTYNDRSFDSWVERLKSQAYSKGISEETLNSAFYNVQQQSFLEYAQLEEANTSGQISTFLTAQQILRNKQILNHYRDVLFEIKHLFGVDEEVIVAIWGINNLSLAETSPQSTIDILTTLSYQQPTNKKIQNELLQALRIIDEGHVSANELKSNSIGNIGTINFNPTQFRTFAVDYDGDGKTDLWRSHADIFASTANFLSSIGWKTNQPWGMEVKLPEEFDVALLGTNSQRTVNKWHELGLRLENGADFSQTSEMASLVKLDEASEKYFLVFDNYFALLRWKRSPKFALATGMMINEIKQQQFATPITPFADISE